MNPRRGQGTHGPNGMLQAMAGGPNTDSHSPVVVVGLGKIGLPLAAHFAAMGLSVIGCDMNPDVVAAINSGHSHIHEEAGLEEAVAQAVDAGRIIEDLRRYPTIVGGIDASSTEKAADFYRRVLDAEVWSVENAETAEFAKLAETTYRDVNIALANELAMYGASRHVNVGEAF